MTELQLSAGRQADQSYPGAYLKEDAYEVFLLVIKSIIVPFYSLHVVLNKAAKGKSQDNNLNSPPPPLENAPAS